MDSTFTKEAKQAEEKNTIQGKGRQMGEELTYFFLLSLLVHYRQGYKESCNIPAVAEKACNSYVGGLQVYI